MERTKTNWIARFFRHETLRSLEIGSVKVPPHRPPGIQDICNGSGQFVAPLSLTRYDLIKKIANVTVKCGECKQPLGTTVEISIQH